MTAAIGFAGLGQMGLPMAERLIAAGHAVRGYDVQPDALSAFERCGGEAVATPADLGDGCPLVITMLPTSAIVAQAVMGDADGRTGISARMAPGSLIVDMSSSRPGDTRQLGRRLAALDIGLVDAPVSGGVPRARSGDLAIMAGGAEDEVERARATVAPLAGTFVRVGPLGAGHAMKALNNLLSAIGLIGAIEVTAAARRYGIDPHRALDVLNASTGKNNSTEKKIAQFVIPERYSSGFALALLRKDVGIALDLMRSLDAPSDLSSLCGSMLDRAIEALPDGADHTMIASWINGGPG